MNDNNIDKIFKDGLSNPEVEVPANVWVNINYQLSTGRRRQWHRIVAIAASVAVLITVSSVGLYNAGNNRNQAQAVAADSSALIRGSVIETPTYADSTVYIDSVRQ